MSKYKIESMYDIKDYPTQGQIYYHFKRDESQGIEHGAYVILGIGMHTEDRSQHFVILKPLYYCEPRKTDEGGINYQVRPIDKFLGDVDRPELNYVGPRFWLIEDEETLSELRQTFLYSSKYLDE